MLTQVANIRKNRKFLPMSWLQKTDALCVSRPGISPPPVPIARVLSETFDAPSPLSGQSPLPFVDKLLVPSSLFVLPMIPQTAGTPAPMPVVRPLCSPSPAGEDKTYPFHGYFFLFFLQGTTHHFLCPNPRTPLVHLNHGIIRSPWCVLSVELRMYALPLFLLFWSPLMVIGQSQVFYF